MKEYAWSIGRDFNGSDSKYIAKYYVLSELENAAVKELTRIS